MLKSSPYVKIRTSVPTSFANKVRQAMGDAGAGNQGNYSHCSSSYSSTGRFMPLVGADPAIGEVGKAQAVKEEIIEMLCHQDLVAKVISAIKLTHPYEEPAIDILPRLELL